MNNTEYWRHTWATLPDDNDTIRRPVEDAVFALIYLEGHPIDPGYDKSEIVGEDAERDTEAILRFHDVFTDAVGWRTLRETILSEPRPKVGTSFYIWRGKVVGGEQLAGTNSSL